MGKKLLPHSEDTVIFPQKRKINVLLASNARTHLSVYHKVVTPCGDSVLGKAFFEKYFHLYFGLFSSNTCLFSSKFGEHCYLVEAHVVIKKTWQKFQRKNGGHLATF